MTARRTKVHVGDYPCGYCSTVHQKPRHELCPVVIRNATTETADKVWYCPCAEADPDIHPRSRGL